MLPRVSTGDKTSKTPGVRPHSYSKATESSKAKKLPRGSQVEEAGSSKSTGVVFNLKDTRLTRKLLPSRKGTLNAAQKEKFKSTPNLMEMGKVEVTPVRSGSKTMEDLESVNTLTDDTLQLKQPGDYSSLRTSRDRPRRSMPLIRDRKFTTAAESTSNESPLNTTFSVLTSPTESSTRVARHPSSDDVDRLAMPPPASHRVMPSLPTSHVTVHPSVDEHANKKTDMSLSQAKNILQGRQHGPNTGSPRSSETTRGSRPVTLDISSEEVESDSRLEPSPIEPPVKDSNSVENHPPSMSRSSTEPALGNYRSRTTWHGRDQCGSPPRADTTRPRRRTGAYRRNCSPSPISFARTFSPMTVVDISSERITISGPATPSRSIDELTSVTDVPSSSQSAVNCTTNGSEPTTTPTPDVNAPTPADGAGSQQQKRLNDFFMSLLRRNSSSSPASDADSSLTSPSDDKPRPGHAAAARSVWEKAIQERDSPSSRKPGVCSDSPSSRKPGVRSDSPSSRKPGVRSMVVVDSNANCIQGEGDSVSEVAGEEKDHAKTYSGRQR